MVQNWKWGGLSFSKDRFMGGDIGLYCQYYDDQLFATSLLNLRHAGKPGNDTKLAELISNLKNVSQSSEDKRLCSFTIPTVFNISTSPYNLPNLDYDLIAEEYYILLAVGNMQGNATAVHFRTVIAPTKISKDIYLDYLSCGERPSSGIFIAVLFSTQAALYYLSFTNVDLIYDLRNKYLELSHRFQFFNISKSNPCENNECDGSVDVKCLLFCRNMVI